LLARGFCRFHWPKTGVLQQFFSNGDSENDMARKMNGEGSVYQRRSDGRWMATVTLGRNEHGKLVRKYLSGRTKAEVLEKMRKVQRNVDDGLPLADEHITVDELLDRWFRDVIRHQVSESTYSNYETVARLHIRPRLGRVKLAKLRPTDVGAFISAKVDEGYSVSTVGRMRSVLMQAIAEAQRWDLVGRNVAAISRGPRGSRAEGRTLTMEQARTLLAFLKGDPYEALFVTVLGLGLRRGEALGLRWSDVDLESRTLTVRHALTRRKSGLVLGEVKTRQSRRSLNLPEPVAKVLVAHRADQHRRQLAAAVWDESDHVFTTGEGGPLDPRNIYRTFVRICDRAGLGHWHPHELRHSAASIMLAAGVPLEVVSNILGHSSIRITADVYGHIMAPQRQAAADKMAAALWGSATPLVGEPIDVALEVPHSDKSAAADPYRVDLAAGHDLVEVGTGDTESGRGLLNRDQQRRDRPTRIARRGWVVIEGGGGFHGE
jgi:integrase